MATWVSTGVNVVALVAAIAIYVARIEPRISEISRRMESIEASVERIREKPVPDWLQERISSEHTLLRERIGRLEDRVFIDRTEAK